jgi:hypothetical protein
VSELASKSVSLHVPARLFIQMCLHTRARARAHTHEALASACVRERERERESWRIAKQLEARRRSHFMPLGIGSPLKLSFVFLLALRKL